MLIYLIRHGIAIDREEPDCPPDAERPLTKKGIEKARLVMEGLRELGAKPDVILSSPLVRAWQTAEIAAKVLHFSRDKIRRCNALLPEADPNALMKELARTKTDQVMCTGHAPHMDEFIAHATGTRRSFTALKKAGVACIEFEEMTPGAGVLIALYPPRVFRLLED
ncbi:MAG TPA: phosphohistidine phosphatase SixA [Candidatus Acidoferrales bacterium]|nr:phosphohistidine phosphatase SixA [Candidatus Acidoferrales bacterium]